MVRVALVGVSVVSVVSVVNVVSVVSTEGTVSTVTVAGAAVDAVGVVVVDAAVGCVGGSHPAQAQFVVNTVPAWTVNGKSQAHGFTMSTELSVMTTVFGSIGQLSRRARRLVCSAEHAAMNGGLVPTGK